MQLIYNLFLSVTSQQILVDKVTDLVLAPEVENVLVGFGL
jgi:hypothetical protein